MNKLKQLILLFIRRCNMYWWDEEKRVVEDLFRRALLTMLMDREKKIVEINSETEHHRVICKKTDVGLPAMAVIRKDPWNGPIINFDFEQVAADVKNGRPLVLTQQGGNDGHH
jgi:hypothetical protein